MAGRVCPQRSRGNRRQGASGWCQPRDHRHPGQAACIETLVAGKTSHHRTRPPPGVVGARARQASTIRLFNELCGRHGRQVPRCLQRVAPRDQASLTPSPLVFHFGICGLCLPELGCPATFFQWVGGQPRDESSARLVLLVPDDLAIAARHVIASGVERSSRPTTTAIALGCTSVIRMR